MVTPFSQLLRPNTWAPLFSSQRTWDQPANPVCSSFRVCSEPNHFFHYSHPAPGPQHLGLGHYPGTIPASRPSWTSLVYFQQCPEWANHKTGHVFPRLRNLRHLRSHSLHGNGQRLLWPPSASWARLSPFTSLLSPSPHFPCPSPRCRINTPGKLLRGSWGRALPSPRPSLPERLLFIFTFQRTALKCHLLPWQRFGCLFPALFFSLVLTTI